MGYKDWTIKSLLANRREKNEKGDSCAQTRKAGRSKFDGIEIHVDSVIIP